MAGEETISTETAKMFGDENLVNETAVPSVGDRTLDEERKNFNNKMGQKITDDDKDEVTVTSTQESGSGSVQSGRTGVVDGGPYEPRTDDSVLLGAPTNRKFPGNKDPSRTMRSDMDSEERATASARTNIRTNLGSKSTRKPWTVPTVKPKVEPQDFEDPISDSFWKNIWVASAVHNVSAS